MKKIQNKTKSIKRIEDEFNKPIELLLLDLYVVQGKTLAEINKLLRTVNKNKVIQLLRECGIYSHKLKSLEAII